MFSVRKIVLRSFFSGLFVLFSSHVFAAEKSDLQRYLYQKYTMEAVFNRELDKQTLPIEKIAALYLAKEALETYRVLSKYPMVFKEVKVFSPNGGAYVSDRKPYEVDPRFKTMLDEAMAQTLFLPKMFVEFEVDLTEYRKKQNDKLFQKDIIQDQGTATMDGDDIVYYPYIHAYTSKLIIPIYDGEPLRYFTDEEQYQGFAFDEEDAFLFILARRDAKQKDKVITIREKGEPSGSSSDGVLVNNTSKTNAGVARSKLALRGGERSPTIMDVSSDSRVSHVLAMLMEQQNFKFLKYPYIKGDPLWPTTLRHVNTDLQTRLGEFKRPGKKQPIQDLPVRNVIFMDQHMLDAFFSGFWEFMYVHQRERDFYAFVEETESPIQILARERKYASYAGDFSCINSLDIVALPKYYTFNPNKEYATPNEINKELEKLKIFMDLYYQYKTKQEVSIAAIVNADERVSLKEKSKYILDLNQFVVSLDSIKNTPSTCYAPDEK